MHPRLLLYLCLLITPLFASHAEAASPPVLSTKLENLIRESKLALRYPVIVETSGDSAALVSTYQESSSQENAGKKIGFELAKVIMQGTQFAITNVHVRLYNPSNIKCWQDIFMALPDVQACSSPGFDQGAIIDSLKSINNDCGLTDGPHLLARVNLYKDILELKKRGLAADPYLLKFAQIEDMEGSGKNVEVPLRELSDLVAQQSLYQRSGSSSSPGTASTRPWHEQKEVWLDACRHEEEARQKLEVAEKQLSDFDPVYQVPDEDVAITDRLQADVEAARDSWQKANERKIAAFNSYISAKKKAH